MKGLLLTSAIVAVFVAVVITMRIMAPQPKPAPQLVAVPRASSGCIRPTRTSRKFESSRRPSLRRPSRWPQPINRQTRRRSRRGPCRRSRTWCHRSSRHRQRRRNHRRRATTASAPATAATRSRPIATAGNRGIASIRTGGEPCSEPPTSSTPQGMFLTGTSLHCGASYRTVTGLRL